MKISFNTFSSPVNTGRNNDFASQMRAEKIFFSSNKKTGSVTKVNLTDCKTGNRVSADLIEKPFNGLYAENEIRVNGKKAGFAKISVSPKSADVPFLYKQNGFLYINLMENLSKGKYKGVGKELLKSVVKRSDDFGFDGRVALTAAGNSHTFHYKFGFEPYMDGREGKKIRDILKREVQSKNPHCEFLGHIDMYLPKDRINEILCV